MIDMNESFPKERVLAAYNSAPQPLRDVFNAESTASIIGALRNKHQLHVDVAGNLGRETGYLLLGLTDPAQFIVRLQNEGLPELVVRDIAMEINQKIFVPLQQKMREGGGGKPAPQVTVPSYKPPPTPPIPQPRPTPPPLPQRVEVFTPQRPVPPPPPNLPGALSDDRLLSDHEEVHINVPSARPAPPQTFSVTLPDSPAPRPMPPPPPPGPLVPKPPMKPIAKYSVDPYREPFDLN